ncbi:hypothetical protein [Novosphingobium sp.]|uniref:hypothetical protein n=1 Tax=Novosphingobium sp. TaxID=1874826 RepID=UPI0035653270
MNDRLTAAALTLAHIALIGGLAASTLATPAQAQGTLQPVASGGAQCPAGWAYAPSKNSRTDGSTCYPSSSRASEIYRRSNGEACRAGYNPDASWCVKGPAAFVEPSSAGTLGKPNPNDRCPTGWYTGSNASECVTNAKPAPSARLKAGKSCRANEVDEWGVWCTSGYEHLSAKQMTSAAQIDFNNIYLKTRQLPPDAVGKNVDASVIKITPVYRKVYGDMLPDSTNATSSNAGATNENAASAASTPSKVCETAEQQGAALGGALGGSRGKALGGLAGAALGGFGKKKSGC